MVQWKPRGSPNITKSSSPFTTQEMMGGGGAGGGGGGGRAVSKNTLNPVSKLALRERDRLRATQHERQSDEYGAELSKKITDAFERGFEEFGLKKVK